MQIDFKSNNSPFSQVHGLYASVCDSHNLVLIKRKTTEPYVLIIIPATSILLTYNFDSADQIFDSEFL